MAIVSFSVKYTSIIAYVVCAVCNTPAERLIAGEENQKFTYHTWHSKYQKSFQLDYTI